MATNIDKTYQLHDALLKVYQDRRAKIRDIGLNFTFVIKMINNPNFKKGYWFHSGENYIATSPYNLFYPEKEGEDERRNRVPALSFGVRKIQNGKGQVYLGLVPWKEHESFFRGVFNYFKDNQRFILEGDKEHVFKLDKEGEYPLSPKGMDADQIKEMLRNFLEADVRVITDIAKEKGMTDEDLFVKADKLQSRLDEVDRIRKTLTPKSNSQVRSEPVTGGDSAQNRKEPLNVIFYGPPGTGKTFHTVPRALKIINGSFPSDRKEQLKLFNELRDKRQIEMITFHQNFSYEDFIEGIMPRLDGREVSYRMNSGIFKKIANRANENKEGSIEGRNEKMNLEDIMEDYAGFIEEAIENEEKISLYGDNGSGKNLIFLGLNRDSSGNFRSFMLGDKERATCCLRYSYIERYYRKFEAGEVKSPSDIRQVNNPDKKMFRAAQYFALFQNMKKHKEREMVDKTVELYAVFVEDKLRKGEVVKLYNDDSRGKTTIAEVERDADSGDLVHFLVESDEGKTCKLKIDVINKNYARIKSGKIEKGSDVKNDEGKQISNFVYYFQLLRRIKDFESEMREIKNYVLIIDEINRGNIAKIFGELITLIEESKRIGRNDELRVTLPYSQTKFGVPDNLYIIGTMNTTDRSLAFLDAALRRRFAFKEMMPKPEKCPQVGDVDCEALLREINKRIERVHEDGRERQIGHAYFMEVENVQELGRVFKRNILPLLQEYFSVEREKISEVLKGSGLVNEHGEVVPDPAWDSSSSYIGIYNEKGGNGDGQNHS